MPDTAQLAHSTASTQQAARACARCSLIFAQATTHYSHPFSPILRRLAGTWCGRSGGRCGGSSCGLRRWGRADGPRRRSAPTAQHGTWQQPRLRDSVCSAVLWRAAADRAQASGGGPAPPPLHPGVSARVRTRINAPVCERASVRGRQRIHRGAPLSRKAGSGDFGRGCGRWSRGASRGGGRSSASASATPTRSRCECRRSGRPNRRPATATRASARMGLRVSIARCTSYRLRVDHEQQR